MDDERTDKRPHPTLPGRNADGTVREGNQIAWRHGARAYEARGEAALPADLRGSVEDFRAQIVRDRGGVDNLTAIETAYIRRLSELETVVRLLASDLASRGLFTPRGRVRNTYCRWLEGMTAWDRFAQRVGVDRRARPVASFAEAVRAAQGDDE